MAIPVIMPRQGQSVESCIITAWNKKVGDTDYCAQHAADVKPKKPVSQCCAMTWEGTRCTRKPDEGYRYCSQHRGQPVSAAKKAEPAKKPAKK